MLVFELREKCLETFLLKRVRQLGALKYLMYINLT